MAGPLAGLRVLDFSAVLMGPSATQILGDFGAEVIKVEPPGGDTTRRIGPGRSETMGSNFLNMNRSKRSLVLDLKHAGARAAVLRLVERSDILVHNTRPESFRRLGLGYEDVAKRNPGIIYCALTGFGSAGPYAGQPAYDDLIQGLAALPALYARAGGTPHYVPTPVADRVAGLHAVIAIVSAVVHRQRTGEGQAIEVPMFESVAHTVLADHMFGETFVPPLGKPGYNRVLSPSRHPYRTADSWLCVLIYTDRHWQSFFRLCDRADLAADPRFATMRSRNEHIDELYGFVEATLRTRTTGEWLDRLRAADVPAGKMNDLDDLLADPHLRAVGFFATVEHPSEGTIRSLRVPTTWSTTSPEPARLAPRLGEHTAEILREAGFSGTEIAGLARSGALGGADTGAARE